MAYDDMVNLKGGILHKKVSVSDPCGDFYAQCSKHPQYWRRIDFSQDIFDSRTEAVIRAVFIQEAQKVIDECPYCLSEKVPETLTVRRCPQEEHDACGCPQ
jgi:hypothetical protein